MPEFSSNRVVPRIPDNLTVEQFILAETHEIRPSRPKAAPWLVADKSESSGDLYLPEIRDKTASLAEGLHAQFGIGEDDVVLIFSSNHIEYPICIWAVHRLCAIVSPCNPTSTVPELTRQLVQTKASLVIAHAAVLDIALASAQETGISPDRVVVIGAERETAQNHTTISSIMAHGLHKGVLSSERPLQPGEGRTKIAFLCVSSGTTGHPKIVAISHFAVIANVLQIAAQNRVNEEYSSWEERRYRPGDVCLAVLPFYRLVVAMHFVLFSGMTVVVVPKFTLKGMLESIVQHKISQLMLVPPQVVLMCKDPIVKSYDLSSVRVILCAAAPLSADINERLVNLFPNAHIGQAYGQTECTGVASMWSTRSKRGTNGGELAPGVVARVVSESGALASYSEPGELFLQTPAAALGYFGDTEATKETFLNDGWIRTGDQVMINEHQEVIYIDRLKEIMKVNGFQVAPAELEGCILAHKFVADVCVIGISDSFSGERPLAFVVLTADASNKIQKDPKAVAEIKTSIMEHVAALKSPYKQLRRVELVETIPKNPSGKLLRRILRDQAKGLVARPSKL